MKKQDILNLDDELGLPADLAEWLGEHQPRKLPDSVIDVSVVAVQLNWGAKVFIDEQAFASLVTSRPDATTLDMTMYERVRLIDLLVHAMPHISACQECPSQFRHWVITSDARQQQPRCIWCQVEQTETGEYLISFADV